MSATIKDVARKAGVSVATVSRVVNASGLVREETRARVERAVEELSYAPHGAARSLITSRTSTVGIVLPDIYGEFFSEVIRGIDLVARKSGYHVLVSSSHADLSETQEVLRAMYGRVDGLVAMIPEASPALLERSLPRSLPVVLLNTRPGRSRFSSLGVDNRGGAAALVRHLLDLGHVRIAHVAGPEPNFDAAERKRGWRDALARAGRPPEPGLDLPGNFDEESGAEAGERLLALRPRPTAVFAANDSMAIGCLSTLRRAGVRVPEEMALAGFDDVPIARFTTPPLTTVRVDIKELGGEAMRRLLAALANGGEPERTRVVLPTELVVRESTAPLRGPGESQRRGGAAGSPGPIR